MNWIKYEINQCDAGQKNKFLSEIFENLDADYQMLISSGKYEPSSRP